LNDGAKIVTCT